MENWHHVFAKFNKPPLSNKPPSNVFEINKHFMGGLKEDLQ